jgi:selenocysteine lyase/cysteine desulfurase
VAKIMHACKGFCFVDFACSGPYVTIDMHPPHLTGIYLDAVFISPHKFLGGPGTPGIMVFNKKLYRNTVPDNSGGGTVEWTNPWGEHEYIQDVEEREDGGTPGFLQLFRAALAFRLKDAMGVQNILTREHDIVLRVFELLEDVPGLRVLASEHRERLPVFSFVIEGLHFKLGVKILNDKFGIQSRGGCSCAGTYGHYLLGVSREQSDRIVHFMAENAIAKPGWIRVSFHPTNTNQEIQYVCAAIRELAATHTVLAADYRYLADQVEFVHKDDKGLSKKTDQCVKDWFLVSGV